MLDHVAKTEHAWVRRELRAAWKLIDASSAKTGLDAPARRLERINPDAAGSRREGLDETLTIIRLGVTGTLARTLATTNPMESTIDIVRVHARNVKWWRDGDMRLGVGRRRHALRGTAIRARQGLRATRRARQRARATRHTRDHRRASRLTIMRKCLLNRRLGATGG